MYFNLNKNKHNIILFDKLDVLYFYIICNLFSYLLRFNSLIQANSLVAYSYTIESYIHYYFFI